jgi:O-antigen ligase
MDKSAPEPLKMGFPELWVTRLLLLIASLSLPVCIFSPASPNLTFSALGILSLLLLILRRDLGNIVLPLKYLSLFLVFTTWALMACLWSPKPSNSLLNVGKITAALMSAVSFYSIQRDSFHKQFMSWFTPGYEMAVFLLILDEILDTHILRTLRGAYADTPEYAHGISLLVIGIWPVLNSFKKKHAASSVLLVSITMVAIFQMTDHAAKLALVIGLALALITYIYPKISLRVGAILSAIIIFGFPFALRYMDPVEVIHDNQSLMLKTSYQHRLFILKRTTDLIFEQPWIGHGINAYRYTRDYSKQKDVHVELMKALENKPGSPYDLQTLGQSTHPHNLSLQIWYELGAVGALLYALFISISLWRLSCLTDRRYELSTFMGMYGAIITIAHVSFGAWQTWWLFSVSILLSLALWQTIRSPLEQTQKHPAS